MWVTCKIGGSRVKSESFLYVLLCFFALVWVQQSADPPQQPDPDNKIKWNFIQCVENKWKIRHHWCEEKKKLLKELPEKFDSCLPPNNVEATKSLWVVSLVKISALQLIIFPLTMLMTNFAEF